MGKHTKQSNFASASRRSRTFRTSHPSPAFTIVELLIVIVVIAILAAVTIVAYNGITSSAKQSANIANVDSYVKGLEVIKASTGSLPTVNGCLGPSSTYTAATGNCPNGGQSATNTDSAALNAQLYSFGVKDVTLTALPGATIIYSYGFYGNPYTIIYTLPQQHRAVG